MNVLCPAIFLAALSATLGFMIGRFGGLVPLPGVSYELPDGSAARVTGLESGDVTYVTTHGSYRVSISAFRVAKPYKHKKETG